MKTAQILSKLATVSTVLTGINMGKLGLYEAVLVYPLVGGEVGTGR